MNLQASARINAENKLSDYKKNLDRNFMYPFARLRLRRPRTVAERNFFVFKNKFNFSFGFIFYAFGKSLRV
jgi:hypothetical protein